MLAIYTGTGVAPEVNLMEHISHTPPQSSNKAEPILALKPRGDITRSPKQRASVAPQMDMCPTKILKKKQNKKNGRHRKVFNSLQSSLVDSVNSSNSSN